MGGRCGKDERDVTVFNPYVTVGDLESVDVVELDRDRGLLSESELDPASYAGASSSSCGETSRGILVSERTMSLPVVSLVLLSSYVLSSFRMRMI